MENQNDIFVKVKFLYPSLTKTEKKIAAYITDHTEETCNSSLEEFAASMQCSDASVLRFCRKLNQNGFVELKQSLLYKIPSKEAVYEITKQDSGREIFEKIVTNYKQSLDDTLALCDDNFEKAMEAFKEADCIAFFGVGDAWPVCEYAQFKMQRVGVKSYAYSDLAMSLATASMLGKRDLAIGISFSGETKLVIDALRVARHNGAKTICITHFDKCRLTKYADYKIFTATQDYTVGNDIIARRTAEFAIVDAFCSGRIISDKQYDEAAKKSLNAIMENK